ncbi:PH domain-containing protein [Metabacillus fastidiosus]|uniref:PH domain-containing protein n=1 Tax=Metabacillus fastidiosus TaxID=1458 RepID=UPI002E1C1863|nr:PH domain-containing protein [Metabacillus fastidiosus]MED4533016.1 PH domain-containing protein [Metabacillus fastidiosus]
MIFYSKIDKIFLSIILVAILMIVPLLLIPFLVDFYNGNTNIVDLIVVFSILFITVGLIIWTTFFIRYIFYESYLFLRAGPFRSKIMYEDITKVKQTNDIFTGYRLLSSKEAIEIFYKTGKFGSVKISPAEKQKFITELKKHCPHTEIEASLTIN